MATREDTFIEAAGTPALTAHTPTGTNAGTAWTQEIISGSAFQRVDSANDYAEADSIEVNNRHLYTLQPDPAVSEYDVLLTAAGVSVATTAPLGLIARMTDASNMYGAATYRASDAADKKIWKMVATVVTELASGDAGVTAGDVFKFEIRDATKKLFQGATERLSTSDNALTSPGRAGFFQGNVFVAADDINSNWKIDDFSYVEVSGGGGATQPPRTIHQEILRRAA